MAGEKERATRGKGRTTSSLFRHLFLFFFSISGENSWESARARLIWPLIPGLNWPCALAVSDQSLSASVSGAVETRVGTVHAHSPPRSAR